MDKFASTVNEKYENLAQEIKKDRVESKKRHEIIENKVEDIKNFVKDELKLQFDAFVKLIQNQGRGDQEEVSNQQLEKRDKKDRDDENPKDTQGPVGQKHLKIT